MTDKQMKMLLFAQQGELDAVAIYNALAAKAKLPKDAAVFRQLAAEEGRHAAVFHAYTGQVLKPKKTKAIALPILYTLLGRKRLYPMIARGEYAAVKTDEPVIAFLPEACSVRDDEKRHGDTVMELLR